MHPAEVFLLSFTGTIERANPLLAGALRLPGKQESLEKAVDTSACNVAFFSTMDAVAAAACQRTGGMRYA